jgi:hypothetical protein
MAAGTPIVEAAADGEFADQAHLSRAVRQLTSMTPRQLQLDAGKPGRAAARSALAGRVMMAEIPHISVEPSGTVPTPGCRRERSGLPFRPCPRPCGGAYHRCRDGSSP